MANPTVVQVTPYDGFTGAVLGSTVQVIFDQLMDTTTITEATFCVFAPGGTDYITPTQLVQKEPNFFQGRIAVPGIFTFSTDSQNRTVVTFSPKYPLKETTLYTIILVGTNSLVPGASIQNATGQPILNNYKWSFQTGQMTTIVPPIISPILDNYVVLDPKDIKLRVNNKNPGDLLDQDISPSYEIDLVFPVNVDSTSFDPVDLLLSIEQFLGDPTISIPTGLTPTLTILNNIIKITLS